MPTSTAVWPAFPASESAPSATSFERTSRIKAASQRPLKRHPPTSPQNAHKSFSTRKYAATGHIRVTSPTIPAHFAALLSARTPTRHHLI
jgi:hypothetical protein